MNEEILEKYLIEDDENVFADHYKKKEISKTMILRKEGLFFITL
jgi:hypothetical protein